MSLDDLHARCCSNTLTNDDAKNCGDYITQTDTCTSFMNNYCDGNNLATGACYTYCNDPDNGCRDKMEQYMNNYCKSDNLLTDSCYTFCNDPNYQCDEQLSNYCGNADTANPNYKKVCSCFLGSEYYTNWQNKQYKNMEPWEADYLKTILPPVAANCSYPRCVDNSSIHMHNSRCVPNNIQICLNNSTVVAGKITDDIIDVKGLINCIQDISSSTTIPPDPTDSPTTPPSENGLTMQKLIIIAVLLLVVVLILGGVGIYVVRK